MAYDNPQSLARIVGWDKYADEDLSPAVFAPLVERVIKPTHMGQPGDEAKVQAAINNEMPPVFDHLQAQLEKCGGTWFVGDQFSYADIALGAHTSNLQLADIYIDSNRWPALGEWFERLGARPAYKRFYNNARNFRPT